MEKLVDKLFQKEYIITKYLLRKNLQTIFLYEIQFQIIILHTLTIINVTIFFNWSNLELKINFHSMLSKINMKIKTRNVEKYIK